MLRRLRKVYGYQFRFRHKTAPVKRVPVIVNREKSPVAAPSSTAGKLTICAIIRDEVPYLQEWIVFHLLRGWLIPLSQLVMLCRHQQVWHRPDACRWRSCVGGDSAALVPLVCGGSVGR